MLRTELAASLFASLRLSGLRGVYSYDRAQSPPTLRLEFRGFRRGTGRAGEVGSVCRVAPKPQGDAAFTTALRMSAPEPRNFSFFESAGLVETRATFSAPIHIGGASSPGRPALDRRV